MTIFSETWDAAFEASPADTDNASQGASKIRGTRVAIQERMEVDHFHAGDSHDGKHKKVSLRPQAGDPTLESGDAAIYTKTTTGLTDVFFKTPLGNVIWLSPRPGTCELTFQPNAQPEWIKINDGSIGNASSNATTRANADCERLFTVLHDNTTNTECQVQDSSGNPVTRGASAAADWAANRRLVIPIALGRALAVAGAGSGLTSRALASRTGAETHQLTEAELAAHTHSGTTDGESGHSHNETAYSQPASGTKIALSDGTGNSGTVNSGPSTGHTHTFTTNSKGGNAAHNNMQPSVFLNVMMKL